MDFSKITYHEYWKKMSFNSLSKYMEGYDEGANHKEIRTIH